MALQNHPWNFPDWIVALRKESKIRTAEELLDKGARNSDKNKVSKLSRFGRTSDVISQRRQKDCQYLSFRTRFSNEGEK